MKPTARLGCNPKACCLAGDDACTPHLPAPQPGVGLQPALPYPGNVVGGRVSAARLEREQGALRGEVTFAGGERQPLIQVNGVTA